MCVSSMVGDHYRDLWWKQQPLWPGVGIPAPMPTQIPIGTWQPPVTREEFETLKRQVEEMKLLLARAKKYDEANGEPECEIEDKTKFLRQVAKSVGIDLDDVLGKDA